MSDNLSALVSFEKLCSWYGFTRPADIKRCLKRDKVPFTTGKDGMPCTTVGLIESALTGSGNDPDAGFDFRQSA